MIPLIRPEFPNLRAVEKFFAPSWRSRQFTNMGDVWTQSVSALSDLMKGWALPVNSGTSAIEVALSVLGAKGKRVALPDYTHSGTLLAVVRAGATPVLFAADPDTWVLDMVGLIENRSKYDLAVVVSPFGYEVNIRSWEDFSNTHEVPLVYDFAGAFGYFPPTKNPRCYSFHSTKNFGVGEGGCAVFSSVEEFEEGRRLSNFGTTPDRSIFGLSGGNLKIDELKAACILAMLEPEFLSKVWRRIQNKNALLDFYAAELGAFVPKGPKKTSLCVLGNLPAQALENSGEREGVTIKRYYPLLSRMNLGVEIVSQSSDLMTRCAALPSDASWSEAYKVVEFVKRQL